MNKKNTIEVNLGIGLNMLFPSPTIVTVTPEDLEEKYQNYLNFVKTLTEPDYNYLIEDLEKNILREMTYDEFLENYEKIVN